MTDETQEIYNNLSDEIKAKIKQVEEEGLTRVEAKVHFSDDDEETYTIGITDDYDPDNPPEDDNEVFYYCDSIEDLICLFKPEEGTDFYITDIYP